MEQTVIVGLAEAVACSLSGHGFANFDGTISQYWGI